MCAIFADPAPAGVVGGRGPVAVGVAGMSVEHGPPPATRGRGPVAAGAAGMLAGHGPPPAARDGSAAPTATPGLSAEHGPLRAAHDRGPTVAIGLRWTCGPDSPSYHAPGGEGMPDYSFLTSMSDSTHESVALERSKSIGV